MDNEIGIDLLMNPRKRAPSRASDNSHVTSIEELEDMIKTVNSKASSSKSKSSAYASSISSASSSSLSSSSASSGSSSSGSSLSQQATSVVKKRLSQDDILNMKREYLYKFDRLEKKGIQLPKKFTLASNIDEMKAEYDRLEKDRRADVSIQFQRQTLMAVVSGIEMLNDKFDPFDVKLSGWSESIYDQIASYDDIFEELHEKWKGSSSMAPELRLMFALGGSAFMFHLRQSMFRSSLADVEQRVNRTARGSSAPSNPLGGLMGSLGGLSGLSGLVGNLFGGGGGAGAGGSSFAPPSQQSQSQSQQGRPTMRGPSDVDDILKEMQQDRVEMMSTISESDISSIQDDISIANKNIFNKKKGKRTMNL